MAKKTKKDVPYYKTLGFDSGQEYWISLWLNELKDKGLIYSIDYQPEAFVLNDEISLPTLNAKGKPAKKVVLKKHVYTADFKIECATRLVSSLLSLSNTVFKSEGNTVYIEVKADTIDCKLIDSTNMTRLFTSRTQPWVYNKFGIYVNLLTPFSLFRDTFVPKKVLDYYYYKKSLVTKKKMAKKGDCKVEYELRDLETFLNRI
jgi:hypothetical protein